MDLSAASERAKADVWLKAVGTLAKSYGRNLDTRLRDEWVRVKRATTMSAKHRKEECRALFKSVKLLVHLKNKSAPLPQPRNEQYDAYTALQDAEDIEQLPASACATKPESELASGTPSVHRLPARQVQPFGAVQHQRVAREQRAPSIPPVICRVLPFGARPFCPKLSCGSVESPQLGLGHIRTAESQPTQTQPSLVPRSVRPFSPTRASTASSEGSSDGAPLGHIRMAELRPTRLSLIPRNARPFSPTRASTTSSEGSSEGSPLGHIRTAESQHTQTRPSLVLREFRGPRGWPRAADIRASRTVPRPYARKHERVRVRRDGNVQHVCAPGTGATMRSVFGGGVDIAAAARFRGIARNWFPKRSATS